MIPSQSALIAQSQQRLMYDASIARRAASGISMVSASPFVYQLPQAPYSGYYYHNPPYKQPV